MSTALIGGLALQGTPQDYSNVAARKQQAAAAKAAKPNRERDALDKQILGALRADAHPALMEELEMRNVEGFRHVYNLFESGDLNAARSALIQLKNDNDHVARTSKQLYEFERFSSQGGHHFPPGWSEFMRSPEFRAGGESRIKAAEEFFNREENQPYKSLFGVGLDGQGRFTIAYDANLGKKLDAGAMFGKSANRIGNMALSEEVGVIDTERNQRLSATQIKERVYQLGLKKAIDIFEQEAANPTFLYNAAMAFPGLRQPKDSPEYQDAREAFIDANLPGTVKTYIGHPSGGSGSRRDVDGRVTTDYMLPFKVGNEFRNYAVPASYALPDKPGTFNLSPGSFRVNEKDQYSRTTEKRGQAEQSITVSNVSIIPVYTGKTTTITTSIMGADNRPVTIELVNGTPLPIEELDRIYREDPKAAAAIGSNVTYKYDAFIIGEAQGRESTGSKVDTHMIPMTETNRSKLAAVTRNPVFGRSNWKSVFGDNAELIGRTGRIGDGQGGGTSSSGGGQPRQQAAPAPTPQGGASQQRGAGNPGISKLTPIN